MADLQFESVLGIFENSARAYDELAEKFVRIAESLEGRRTEVVTKGSSSCLSRRCKNETPGRRRAISNAR